MKTKISVEIKIEAVAEIEEAFYYYENRQAGLGEAFQKYIDRTIKGISKNPSGYRKVSKEKRQAVVKKFPFVIIYEVFDSKIIVFAVFHTSRNPIKKIKQ